VNLAAAFIVGIIYHCMILYTIRFLRDKAHREAEWVTRLVDSQYAIMPKSFLILFK
jgi:hypothetical protein